MSRRPRIPTLFWVQAVIDTVRVLVWLVISIWGWSDSTYFSWITPVLFLIPTHYIWLIKGMRLRLREAGLLTAYTPLSETVAGYRATADAARNQKLADHRVADIGYVAPEPVLDYAQPYDNAPPVYESATKTEEAANPVPPQRLSQEEARKRAHIYYLAMFLAPLGFAMWFIALIDLIFQHYYPNGPTSKQVAYRVPIAVLTNPYLLSSTLPKSCANWLSSANSTNNIGHIGLLNNPSAQGTAGYTHLILWIVPTAIAGHAVIAALLPLSGQAARKAGYTGVPVAQSVNQYLRNMAFIIPLLLLVGAVITGGTTGSKATHHQSVQLRYTNNATQTGGCDWAVVSPDYTWGAFDISERRVLRIVMAVLGL